jgi:hypothetical protein
MSEVRMRTYEEIKIKILLFEITIIQWLRKVEKALNRSTSSLLRLGKIS